MNAETFLEQFETFAEAPNGVEQLRAMILQLAVQGKLGTQDPNDQPAISILERARSFADGKTRNTDVSSSASDVPIPTGWIWTTLSQLGVVSPRNKLADDLEVSFVPMAAISTQYKAPLNPEARVWSDVKQGFTHLADGDIAMAKITPCFQNCKTTAIRDLKNGFGAGTTELHVLRPYSDCIEPNYVVIFLRSPTFVADGVSRMSGSAGQQRVPKEHFAESPFPLPPLAEQKRIVAKVDQLLALCDELAARQEARRVARTQLVGATLDRLVSTRSAADLPPHVNRLRTHFDHLFDTPTTIPQLRQTILQLAVQGQLVPQDPNDEPAPIQPALADGRKRGLAANDLEPTAEWPFEVPQNWRWLRLRDTPVSLKYGTSVKCDYEGNGVPVLRIPNVVGGRIDLDDLKYGELSDKEQEDLRVEQGDLLLIRSNGSTGIVGRTAVVDENAVGFAYAGYLVRVRYAKTTWLPEFLHLALISQPTRDQIEGPIRTTSGVKNINSTEIGRLMVPLPPLAEQKRIVAKVTELLSLCDTLEAQLQTAESASSQLLSAAVHHLLRSEAPAIHES